MREVVIYKKEFDNLVYPAVALALHQADVKELRMNDKVSVKLEAEASETSDPPSDEEVRIIGSLIPMFELNGDKATFSFEDSEAEYLVNKLKDLLPKIHGRILRPLLPIFAALRKPEDE